MKKSIVFLVLLVAISLLAVFMPAVPGQIVTEGINSGDTAWMLAATALSIIDDSRPCLFLWRHD